MSRPEAVRWLDLVAVREAPAAGGFDSMVIATDCDPDLNFDPDTFAAVGPHGIGMRCLYPRGEILRPRRRCGNTMAQNWSQKNAIPSASAAAVSPPLGNMHPVLILLLMIGLPALIFGPSLWVHRVMSKYREPAQLYQGTGVELARQLIADLGLDGVGVEEGKPGQDHYDPRERKVRLAPDHYHGHSLTAVTIAAHEVGHAQQHADGYAPLTLRTALARLAMRAERLGAFAIVLIPVVAMATRSPALGAATFAIGISSLAIGALVHLITLPVELDASFRRALPVLRNGGYIPAAHLPHARRLLLAAALTYVAASLAGLLNLYRWIAILRR
jgi:Zn-dependent membrane protease YugP